MRSKIPNQNKPNSNSSEPTTPTTMTQQELEFKQRELALQYQMLETERNALKIREEALQSERRGLESERRAFESEKRIHGAREKQIDLVLKQSEEEFEMKRTQRAAKFETKMSNKFQCQHQSSPITTTTAPIASRTTATTTTTTTTTNNNTATTTTPVSYSMIKSILSQVQTKHDTTMRSSETVNKKPVDLSLELSQQKAQLAANLKELKLLRAERMNRVNAKRGEFLGTVNCFAQIVNTNPNIHHIVYPIPVFVKDLVRVAYDNTLWSLYRAIKTHELKLAKFNSYLNIVQTRLDLLSKSENGNDNPSSPLQAFLDGMGVDFNVFATLSAITRSDKTHSVGFLVANSSDDLTKIEHIEITSSVAMNIYRGGIMVSFKGAFLPTSQQDCRHELHLLTSQIKEREGQS